MAGWRVVIATRVLPVALGFYAALQEGNQGSLTWHNKHSLKFVCEFRVQLCFCCQSTQCGACFPLQTREGTLKVG